MRSFLFLVLLYSAFDSFVFRPPPIEKALGAVIVLLAIFMAFTALTRGAQIRDTRLRIFGATLILIISGVAAAGLAPHQYSLLWFSTDVGIFLILVCSIILFSRDAHYAIFMRNLRWLVFFLILIAVLTYFFGERVNNRYSPPTSLAVAGVAFLPWKRGMGHWILRITAYGLLGFLCFFSGERTSFIIWVLVGLAGLSRIMLFSSPLSRLALAVGVGVIALGWAISGASLGSASISKALRESRFSALMSGEQDSSLEARLLEASDAITTLSSEGGYRGWMIGLGHGAAYVPRLSYISRNVSEGGVVHHIHIGPALLLFRYGMVGILWYLAVWWVVTRKFLSMLWHRGPIDELRMVVVMTAMMDLLSSLMFNNFANPLAMIVLGAAVATRDPHYTVRQQRYMTSHARAWAILSPARAEKPA